MTYVLTFLAGVLVGLTGGYLGLCYYFARDYL